MTRQFLLSSIVALILLLSPARAADLEFVGTPTFSVAKGKVNLVIPKILNKSTTASGAIIVQVWAWDAPFAGQGGVSGYIIGSKTLGALKGGAQHINISTAVPLKLPALNRTYYTTISLQEAKPNAPFRDYVNSAGTITFDNLPKISLQGDASWSLSVNTLKMAVTRIVNGAYSGRSGTLRLEVWATPAPYAGGSLQGAYMLGASVLGPVSGGYSLEKLARNSAYKAPPGGYYHLTLMVSEYTRLENGKLGYVPRDYIPLPDSFYFGGPTANAPKLDLQGPASWAILGTTIKITVGKVINPRNGSASGALQIKLYTTPEPYTGTLPPDAKLLATANLGTVKGKATLSNAARTVAFTVPPAGTNYTVILLTEAIAPNQTVEQDYFAFASTVALGDKKPIGLNEGTPLPNPVPEAIDIPVRKSSYSLSKNLVNMKTPTIGNYRTTPSGDLRLELWIQSLTNETQIYKVADRPLGQLAPGAIYTGVNGTVPFIKPPIGGKYRVALILYNYVDDWPYAVHQEILPTQLVVK